MRKRRTAPAQADGTALVPITRGAPRPRLPSLTACALRAQPALAVLLPALHPCLPPLWRTRLVCGGEVCAGGDECFHNFPVALVRRPQDRGLLPLWAGEGTRYG